MKNTRRLGVKCVVTAAGYKILCIRRDNNNKLSSDGTAGRVDRWTALKICCLYHGKVLVGARICYVPVARYIIIWYTMRFPKIRVRHGSDDITLEHIRARIRTQARVYVFHARSPQRDRRGRRKAVPLAPSTPPKASRNRYRGSRSAGDRQTFVSHNYCRAASVVASGPTTTHRTHVSHARRFRFATVDRYPSRFYFRTAHPAHRVALKISRGLSDSSAQHGAPNSIGRRLPRVGLSRADADSDQQQRQHGRRTRFRYVPCSRYVSVFRNSSRFESRIAVGNARAS